MKIADNSFDAVTGFFNIICVCLFLFYVSLELCFDGEVFSIGRGKQFF